MSDQDLAKLRRQLRVTQGVTGVLVAAVAVLATSSLRGNAALKAKSIDVGPHGIDDEGVHVVGIKGAAAVLRAREGGAFAQFFSGTSNVVLAADRMTRNVSLVATGVVRSELRFDTTTGALLLVRRVDANIPDSREVIVELVAPIRQ